MSLFVCDQCLSIENTALGNFWPANYRGGLRLCSECFDGAWHGRFDKRKATASEIMERMDEFVDTDGMRAVLEACNGGEVEG